MTVTTTTSASKLTARSGYGPFDLDGAQIRAHYRHLATVVTIQGTIDAGNIERVSAYIRRFVLVKSPLVLDLSGVDSFAAVGISLLHLIDQDCQAAGVEWTLVASSAIIDLLCEHDGEAMLPITRSVHEALRDLADGIANRRQLLLPLIRKTA